MQISFLGAAQTVTGSCYLIETGLSRIMVDCGLFQGSKEIKERNYRPIPVLPVSVDYLLLTHAHIDHSGLIPKFIKEGFQGRIKATNATVDLCGIMLPDCGHIQEMEVERKNRKYRRAGRPTINPIYTAEEGFAAMEYFDRVEYNQVVDLTPDIRVRFVDAGHMLGSAMVEIWVKEADRETKILFSGDIGNDNQPFLNDPSIIEEADYVIMESTYGNRLHLDMDNKTELLKQAILDTYNKGGNLIIPGFAVGRTQELVYEINQLQTQGVIPSQPIYIDSPMAVAATKLYNKHWECYDQEASALVKNGANPLEMPNLKFTVTAEESQMLNFLKGRNIIISASGMCDAGRIKHHLRHNLWRADSTVLFVGYQAEGTLGRRILSGEKFVRIHGEEVMVRAEIRKIDGYSAHADQRGLLGWLDKFKKQPQKVIVVHGEPKSAAVLVEKISANGLPAYTPQWMETMVLTPAIEANMSQVQQAYKNVLAKLEHIVNLTGNDPAAYKSVLAQLTDIENRLNLPATGTAGH